MSYNNVFLAYNVNIDQSKSVSYAIEQYGERTEQKICICIGDGPVAVMHS